MPDPEDCLVPPGQNSRAARKMVFQDVSDIHEREKTIRAYVAAAIEIEKAGMKVEMPKDDLPVPDEFDKALDADPRLKAAFEALTPGRRRSWLLHIGQAKRSATRESRIRKAEPKILEGKGLNDR